MTYAKIQDDKIVKTGQRPRWFADDGKPVTDEVLRQHGWLPVHYETPEYDVALQRVSLKHQREWAIETKRVVAAYEIREIPIDQMRDAKLQEATDMRWTVWTGGMTLPNGIRVETDEASYNRVTSVISGYEASGLSEESVVSFKAASGFAKLTIAEIKQIAGMMGLHMQACFAMEEAHFDAINALETREEIAAYDTSTGWPNQGDADGDV